MAAVDVKSFSIVTLYGTKKALKFKFHVLPKQMVAI
jgi:hypothetical protein